MLRDDSDQCHKSYKVYLFTMTPTLLDLFSLDLLRGGDSEHV